MLFEVVCQFACFSNEIFFGFFPSYLMFVFF